MTSDELNQIEIDKGLTHAVEAASAPAGDPVGLAQDIQHAFTRLNRRALHAEMVMVNQMVSVQSFTETSGEPGIMVIITCQWIERSKMEAAQRQTQIASLMAVPPRGRS